MTRGRSGHAHPRLQLTSFRQCNDENQDGWNGHKLEAMAKTEAEEQAQVWLPAEQVLLSARRGALKGEVGASYPGTGASPAIEDWQQYQQVGPGPSSLGVGCPVPIAMGGGRGPGWGLSGSTPSVRVSE